MRSAFRSFAVLAAVVGGVAVALLLTAGPKPASIEAEGPGFSESFDNHSPAQPLAFSSDRWDVTVHHRDREWWYQAEPMDGAHGPNCEGPPATHPITTYADSVYNCRNHLMTGLNASGAPAGSPPGTTGAAYGLIYLTPDHMVDFSTGEAVIQWDMSTFRTSARDWVDLWITPWGDQLQAPLETELPDLNGRPRNAIHVRMSNFFPQGGWWTSFELEVIRDFQAQTYSHSVTGYEAFLQPDKARRDTFELRISQDRVSFGMPDYGFEWFDTSISPLSWDQGIVQWGQHSYTPWKDGGNGPNSYHWDNFSISPSLPFSIIASDRRFVDATSPTQTFELSAPAPANSNLRFMGIGTLEASFDGGVGWQTPQRQAMEKAAPEHFKSYWTSIPQGATSVTFRGGPDSYWQHWHVRDASVFSSAQGQSSAPPPSTPTATPTPSRTPIATPSPTPTATPTPTPTPPGGTAPLWEFVSVSAPQTATVGQTVSLTATVRNAGGSGSLLVDVELTDPSGAKVGQRFWDAQAFSAGETRSFTYQHTFAAGSAGAQAVHVGLFEPAWGPLISWQADAASVSVSSSFSVSPVGSWDAGVNSATVVAQQPLSAAALAQSIAADSGRVVAQLALLDGSGWRFYRPGLDSASNLGTIFAGVWQVTVLLQ